MKRTPVTRIMKAKALTSPIPEFVSQVRTGANQEPVRVVKMDADEIAPLFANQELTMKDAVKKAKSAGHDIAQLVFKGGQFPDRASVDAWLKEGGFEGGYDVTEKTDKDGVTEFTVVSTATKFETGSIKKVKGTVDGLNVFVGKVEGEIVAEKTAEEIAAETAAIKPSTITSAKGDEPAAVEGTKDAPAAVVEKTAEELAAEEAAKAAAPAATPEAPAATVAPEVTATKTDAEVAAEERKTKADAIVAELRTKSMYDVSNLGGVLSTLRWMVYDAEYGGVPDDAVASIKTAAANLLDALVSTANAAIADYVEAFKSAEQKTATKTAETTETPAAPAVEATAKEDAIPEGLTAVLKSMSEAITAIATSVKEQGEVITEVQATATKAAEEASQKGQTRKGADVTEPVATAPETSAQKSDANKHAERRLRSSLGSYRAHERPFG